MTPNSYIWDGRDLVAFQSWLASFGERFLREPLVTMDGSLHFASTKADWTLAVGEEITKDQIRAG
jgi:hypothetical protein